MDRSDYPHLSKLVDNEELWMAVHDFDRILSNSRQRIPDIQIESAILGIAHELHELAFEHFHLILVFRFKTRELARGIFDAILASNYVVLFNMARAFLEHTASFAYQDQALQRAVVEISSRQSADQIWETIANHRNTTRRLYYGGEGSPIQVNRIHVNDLLKALEKMSENAISHYDSLCEFVHPNYGSNTLVSSGDLASGKIGIHSDLLLAEARLAREIIERYAEIDSQLVLSGTGSLITISSWVTIASRGGAKISQIFSLRTAHTGDGETKETAIFFNKARTHEEAIKAFYKYIEDKGLTINARQMAGIENGFLFDIVNTSNGLLWVRYRMPE
jgi:hypothetical protein